MILTALSVQVALACHPMDNGCMADQNIRKQHEQQQQDLMYFAMNQAQAPSQAPPPPRPVREVGSHGALVWFTNREGQPDFSLAANHPDPLEAQVAAMSRCYHRGGRSCRLGLSWTDGTVAVVRAEDGSLYAGLEGSRSRARAGASTLCRDRAGGRCKLVEVAQSLNWYVYADE
jgi:hypothetical protein